jgi:hypothetical protein
MRSACSWGTRSSVPSASEARRRAWAFGRSEAASSFSALWRLLSSARPRSRCSREGRVSRRPRARRPPRRTGAGRREGIARVPARGGPWRSDGRAGSRPVPAGQDLAVSAIRSAPMRTAIATLRTCSLPYPRGDEVRGEVPRPRRHVTAKGYPTESPRVWVIRRGAPWAFVPAGSRRVVPTKVVPQTDTEHATAG